MFDTLLRSTTTFPRGLDRSDVGATDMFPAQLRFKRNLSAPRHTGPASSCAIPNYDQYYILAQNTCESEGYVTSPKSEPVPHRRTRIVRRRFEGFRDQPAQGYVLGRRTGAALSTVAT